MLQRCADCISWVTCMRGDKIDIVGSGGLRFKSGPTVTVHAFVSIFPASIQIEFAHKGSPDNRQLGMWHPKTMDIQCGVFKWAFLDLPATFKSAGWSVWRYLAAFVLSSSESSRWRQLEIAANAWGYLLCKRSTHSRFGLVWRAYAPNLWPNPQLTNIALVCATASDERWKLRNSRDQAKCA